MTKDDPTRDFYNLSEDELQLVRECVVNRKEYHLDEETSAHLKALVADFVGVAHGRTAASKWVRARARACVRVVRRAKSTS